MKRYKLVRHPRRRLVISFSGGETSAYMTWLIFTQYRAHYDEIACVFANTGQEHDGTYEFIERFQQYYGIPITWIEGVTRHNEKRMPGFRIVTAETADRTGRPFEDAIRKYGIPNQTYKDCTRNLKRRPIEAYIRDHLKWEAGSYELAIGIRIDESDRQSVEVAARGLVYPLISWKPTTKRQINSWWARQPFRLTIKSYEGNCRWCWKKSLRKHLTLIKETPEIYDFPRRMEEQYARVGGEFSPAVVAKRGEVDETYRRRFFRDNLSTEDLFALYEQQKDTFTPANDDRHRYATRDLLAEYDEELDLGAGCEESCEVYGPDDQDSETQETW